MSDKDLAASNPDFCSSTEVTVDKDYSPYGPLVQCSYLDARWIDCEDAALVHHLKLQTIQRSPFVHTSELPCLKFTKHYFLTTLLYSIFLGMLAVDRFYLGYSAIAVGKLMTLGGLGVGANIFLLINGNLMPADDSQWQPLNVIKS
uniref:TM2 domain-containing protein n=1 Tax=Ditylenchus dipsaci TaxID=166011 RepID=A0A915D7E6_9BILA